MNLLTKNMNLSNFLSKLKETKIQSYDRTKLKEQTSSIARIEDFNSNKCLTQLDLTFLFNYSIFPAHIMTTLSQWIHENRSMKVDDVIVQQIQLPPSKKISLKAIFGVQINDLINEEYRIGYSYETLTGHVEKGISTFTIEKVDNILIFKIHTFSTPSNAILKFFGPIIALPYQKYCTNSTLKNVKNQFLLINDR